MVQPEYGRIQGALQVGSNLKKTRSTHHGGGLDVPFPSESWSSKRQQAAFPGSLVVAIQRPVLPAAVLSQAKICLHRSDTPARSPVFKVPSQVGKESWL